MSLYALDTGRIVCSRSNRDLQAAGWIVWAPGAQVRAWLLADGAIEKGRDGFQGPFRYRRAERAAVAESEAASPEAAGVRAVPEAPEVPERFAATLRVLAGAPMAAAEIHPLAVALDRLAMDCGYSLDRLPPLVPLEAP